MVARSLPARIANASVRIHVGPRAGPNSASRAGGRAGVEHKFLPDRVWGRDSRKKCVPPSRSGPPWELRREYRHTALPNVFSSRPSAPQRKPRPPNAPRDQPTRGALWLSCRRPSCQSGSRTRSYESPPPQGRALTSRWRALGGPPWELRREYRHIALPHVFHVFSSRPSAPQRKPRPPNAPRDQPTRGALWLSCRRPSCQSGSRTRSYESMSPQGRAPTSRWRALGGPPWELRREYRHIALPHVFSSRPSAPQRKPRPPNAPRDQPTRGALWLSCRRPSCQSGSRTRSYESMSPQGRAHTSRERGLEKALPTQSPRDLVEYGGFCARPCPSKRRAEKDRTDRPRQEAAMGRSPPPQRNRNPRGARDHWRASRSFVDCSSGESNDLN